MVPVVRSAEAAASRQGNGRKTGGEFGCEEDSAHECYPRFGYSDWDTIRSWKKRSSDPSIVAPD